MAGNGIPTLGRVKVCDLLPTEGIPSDTYKLAVTTLSQSLAQYSAAIIQFPPQEAALLRSGLDSARLYFHQRDSYPNPNDMIHTANDSSREWCKTSGYYSDPHSWQESYEYRPGLTFTESASSASAGGGGGAAGGTAIMELPPSGLPDIFSLLGKASRLVLDAIGFYLNLRSSPFSEILDNAPLRSNEVSSSVLSVCCYARPSFHGGHLTEDEQVLLYSDHNDHQLDKSLISFSKSDKPGLHVRDMHGQWILVDVDLGPQEAVVFPGLALYQATAGYVSPAVYRTDLNSMQGSIEGRFSLAFKLMPKSMTHLSCSEMRAAGHGVDAQFQVPVLVDDFMQRAHSNDEVFNRQTLQSFSVPQSQDGIGSMKQMKKRKKGDSRLKPLPPSKRLRLEAQRVLKERVQEIADKKGIKLRFCNPKDCESNHNTMNSPCAHIKMEIGWPQGVPFVHPHDLPNKAKIGFLETYEPGWSETHDMELSLSEAAQGNQHVA